MKLNLNFTTGWAQIRRNVVVVVKRGKGGKIIYNSGKIYINWADRMEEFKNQIRLSDPTLELYDVDVHDAHEPEDYGRGIYCPYCQQWEVHWVKGNGYRYCPICGVSDHDFDVKRYNHLWGNTLEE